jgi:hypothetical protein
MVVPNDSESQEREAPIHIDAQDARAGEIVLRKRWQRWVFNAGLVGIVALLAILRFVAWG